MKQLMLGNEAVARGLYQSGCRVVSSYPGTPSTEITEAAVMYKEIYCEWAPNEKVAMETAIGASIGGARSFCAMKHVGLNVAADPLFTLAYTGVNGGLVIAVADDPGMHSSQNEQDSRHYAIASKIPMLEPADSAECLAYVGEAYTLSERCDTPVLLRLSTRISHSQSVVETADRIESPLREYKKDPSKYVMMPGNARGRHVAVEKRQLELVQYAETTSLNVVEPGDPSVGIICSGINYQYAREVMPHASFLKLGLVHPLPVELIKRFAASVKTLYVVEDLDPVIETHCRAIGVPVIGKTVFPLLGELSQAIVAEKLAGRKAEIRPYPAPVPPRPPVMCPGCPHRGLFYTLGKMNLFVSGDIGCYTLGATPPLNAMDTTICMGASISALHGFNKAQGEEAAARSVAVIGDSTFMHSGITGLINIVYNKGIATVIVVDNHITGMTGHQENPTTGRTLDGRVVPAVSIEKVCEAAGVKRVRVVDPNDLTGLEALVGEELAAAEPSVIIARRPCALLKSVEAQPASVISAERCAGCKACMRIGCPAISFSDKQAHIDVTLCVGCGLCAGLCRFDAIGAGKAV